MGNMKLIQIHIQEGTMVKILELFPDVDDFLLFDSSRLQWNEHLKNLSSR